MTMWLLSAVMAPVKPVSGKKNWFELDGIPKSLGYADIGEWLSDEIQNLPQGSKIVKNAKLVGVHDNNNLLTDDPRFNHRSNIAGDDPEFQNEPEFVIVKQRPDLYLCAMMVNAPESVFFEYAFKAIYPHKTDWQGEPEEWRRIDPKIVKEYADLETEREKMLKAMQAKHTASKKTAVKKAAAKAAAGTPTKVQRIAKNLKVAANTN